MLSVVIAEGVAIALLALLVAGLLRSHAEILKALHDLGAAAVDDDADSPRAVRRSVVTRTDAVDVVGTDPTGEAVAVAVTGVESDTVLAFLSTGCSTCEPFWSALRNGVTLPDDARLVVVVQDGESPARLLRLGGEALTIVASDAAWTAYEVPGSPHFVHVDGRTGRVTGEGTGPDWPSVARMLGQAVDDRETRRTGSVEDVEWRDNPTRIDAELTAAGIGAGHPSLVTPPDARNSDPTGT